MEPQAALQLLEDCWKKGYKIKNIVCDDDSSVKSILHHSYQEMIDNNIIEKKNWPKTPGGYKKADNGKLPLYIPIPNFLADPTHRIKVCSKHFFTLSFEQFMKASNAPLEHLFNNHEFCSSEWCPIKSGGKYEEFKYKDKHKDKNTYEKMKEIWKKFTSESRLRECWHTFDSQMNESMNFAVTRRAPKSRTYATTLSLRNRVLICVGEHNLGLDTYWCRVFDSMSIDIGRSLRNYLEKKQNDIIRIQNYKRQPGVKRKRTEEKNRQMTEYVKKDIEAIKKGMLYGNGVGIVESNEQLKKKQKTKQRCPHCGKDDHVQIGRAHV